MCETQQTPDPDTYTHKRPIFFNYGKQKLLSFIYLYSGQKNFAHNSYGFGDLYVRSIVASPLLAE